MLTLLPRDIFVSNSFFLFLLKMSLWKTRTLCGRVLVFAPRLTEGSAYYPSPSAFPALLSLILESFRFEDEGDYEYEIISILSIARA